MQQNSYLQPRHTGTWSSTEPNTRVGKTSSASDCAATELWSSQQSDKANYACKYRQCAPRSSAFLSHTHTSLLGSTKREPLSPFENDKLNTQMGTVIGAWGKGKISFGVSGPHCKLFSLSSIGCEEANIRHARRCQYLWWSHKTLFSVCAGSAVAAFRTVLFSLMSSKPLGGPGGSFAWAEYKDQRTRSPTEESQPLPNRSISHCHTWLGTPQLKP